MNCYRAYETDLEDLLIDPESVEFREFETHCAGCSDCAAELALHRGLLARLKDEPADAVEHPADAVLLQLARRPESLAQEERAELRAHLRDCHPCDDAYRATLMLVPEPQLSPVARAVEAVRGWLSPSALPAWAPVAAALVLAVGIFMRVGVLGPDETPPELRVRALPGHYATVVEITPSHRGSLELYGLDDEEVVLLRVPVSQDQFGSEVLAKISSPGGDAPIFEAPLAWERGETTSGFLEPKAGIFDRDSYRIELVAADGGTRTYWLDVR
jgi:hypothetical protein